MTARGTAVHGAVDPALRGHIELLKGHNASPAATLQAAPRELPTEETERKPIKSAESGRFVHVRRLKTAAPQLLLVPVSPFESLRYSMSICRGSGSWTLTSSPFR